MYVYIHVNSLESFNETPTPSQHSFQSKSDVIKSNRIFDFDTHYAGLCQLHQHIILVILLSLAPIMFIGNPAFIMGFSNRAARARLFLFHLHVLSYKLFSMSILVFVFRHTISTINWLSPRTSVAKLMQPTHIFNL